LPFDFFLNSLADNYGKRAVCVILSGTGNDGSVGLRAVSEKGGLVIAQDPGDTTYEGCPQRDRHGSRQSCTASSEDP